MRDTQLASLVAAQLVSDPAPGTNGVAEPEEETGWLSNGTREGLADLRPPTTASGWMSKGEPAPGRDAAEAMRSGTKWRPPRENGAGNHSVFMDVEV